MPQENPPVKTIEKSDNPNLRRVQYGCLIALLVMEAFYFLLEQRGNGVACTWIEVYGVVPAMLFLGATVSTRRDRPTRHLLAFGAAFMIWFAVVKTIHRIEGTGDRNIGAFFCANGLCLPFARASGDGKQARGLRWVSGLYLGLGTLLAGYCWMLLMGCVPEFLREYVRWDGTRFTAMLQPNICAVFLMCSIGACLLRCCKTKKAWPRILLAIWIVVLFAVITLTNSRTTIVLTCVLIGGSLFCALRKSGRKRLIVACLAAAVLMGGLFVGSRKLSETRKKNITDSQETVQVPNVQGSWENDMKTLNGRTVIWRSACQGLRDNPGILLEGTEYTDLIISQYNYFQVAHAHNSWFQVLYELGIPGLLLALVLTAVAVYDALVVFWHNPDPVKSVTALLVLCILGCSALEPYLFTANVLYHPIHLLFLLLAGYLDCWRAELKEKI